MAESTVQLLGAALPLLIRLFWILATGAAAIALMPVNIAPAFRWAFIPPQHRCCHACRHHLDPLVPRRSAVLLSACRGKLMEVKPPAALGPLSDWEVPQRWFAHFYAVGAAWNALVALLLASSPHFSGLTGGQQATYLAALSLLQLHLIRRLLETVGIMKYPRGACMHGVAYLFGLRWVTACELYFNSKGCQMLCAHAAAVWSRLTARSTAHEPCCQHTCCDSSIFLRVMCALIF